MENIGHSDPEAAVCPSVLDWNKNCHVQKKKKKSGFNIKKNNKITQKNTHITKHKECQSTEQMAGALSAYKEEDNRPHWMPVI